MKYFLTFVFSMFLFVQSQASTSSHKMLDPDEFLVTHITHHFPKDGIMIPAMTRTSDNSIPDPKKEPNPRMTLHWYAFNILTPHAQNDPTQAKYVIIEKGREIASRFIGGFYEDLFMIGPHKLSTSSLILAPNSEVPELTQSNPSYQGKFIGYDSKSESATQAASRIFEEYQLNPRQIKLIPKKQRVKITKKRAREIIQFLKVQPSTTGARIIKEGSNIFLEEEVKPLDQVVSVDGQEIKAITYLTPGLPKDFKWYAHSESCFGQFEEITKRLFIPLLFLGKGEIYTAEDIAQIIPDRGTLIEMAKKFTSLYQQIAVFQFQGSYRDDEPLVKDYLFKWKNNIQAWYGIVKLQSDLMRTKPLSETPYGNPRLLSGEITKIRDTIQIFTGS